MTPEPEMLRQLRGNVAHLCGRADGTPGPNTASFFRPDAQAELLAWIDALLADQRAAA